MNIWKMVTGITRLICWTVLITATSPVWLLLLAYDLGSPCDDKDRMGEWLDKMASICGIKYVL